MSGRASLMTIAAVVALAAPFAAFAQPAPPGPALAAEMRGQREAIEAQRHEDLRTILRLRPDQQAAFSAFVQAVKPPPGAEGMDAPKPRPMEHLTTPQRLNEMAQREARFAGERQHRTEALQAFYAALSPEQRQVFDALMRFQGPPPALGGPPGPDGPHRPPLGPWGGPPPGA